MGAEHEQKLHLAKGWKLEQSWRWVLMGLLACAVRQLGGEEMHLVLMVQQQGPSEDAFSLPL